MKKVIFITNCLITGGVEKSLYELISHMDTKKYEISVGVCKENGDFENKIKKFAKVFQLPGINKNIKTLVKEYLKKKRILHVLKILVFVVRCHFEKNYMKKCEILAQIYPSLEEKYDFAICYHKPTDLPTTYTLYNITAKQKILWIHSEIDNNELSQYLNVYSQYDKICVVSESLKCQILKYFPTLNDKVIKFLNIVDNKEIYKKSTLNKITLDNNYKNILTVGRLSLEKGQLIIPNVVKIIKERTKFKIKWFLIGDGNIREEIERKIIKYDLIEEVILLGNMSNPYPYMKECDIYVQPSLQEGYCITVREALLFLKPIVVTNFLTAKELIKNNKTGLICNFSEEEIANSIIKLIGDKSLQELFRYNIKNENQTRNIIEEIEYLFEEKSV